MPISTSVPINHIDKAAFHRIDEMVTVLALDIQRDSKRMIDGNLYQTELADRIQQAGHAVERNVRVTASFDDYHKEYRIDLIVAGNVVVKAKTAIRLTRQHKAQLTNSVFLTNANHGTLLNFGAENLEHHSISTSRNESSRKKITCTSMDWKILTPTCRIFHDALCRVLCDWGSGLDVAVYRDAVLHFLGRNETMARDVEMTPDQRPMGRRKMHLLTKDLAFAITDSGAPLTHLVERHRQLLQETKLKALQLANLNGQHLSLHTIQRN